MEKQRMPIMFVGHGNPMNAIEDNEFSQAWITMAGLVPRPRAILCISAHWETPGTMVTAMEQPKTIHDFYGFPPELFAVNYPAPGSMQLAEEVRSTVKTIDIGLDQGWGLDHGCWSVLARMFPKADIPVLQLSLDRDQSPRYHYELGAELKSLRDQGVLIIGSGNIVHNLRLVVWEDTAFDWAVDFDARIKEWILQDNREAMIEYDRYGRPAQLAVNSAEHYEPLLYIMGLKETGEQVRFFAEKVWGGSVSMRSVLIG